jgi:hypothetical protein
MTILTFLSGGCATASPDPVSECVRQSMRGFSGNPVEALFLAIYLSGAYVVCAAIEDEKPRDKTPAPTVDYCYWSGTQNRQVCP